MKGSIKHRKNKFFFGLLVSLTGLLFTFCTSEPDGTGIDPLSRKESFFSMNIDAGEVFSTRNDSGGDKEGTADELKIYSVRVVLYDGEDLDEETCKVEYAFEFDIKSPDGWNNPDDAVNWVKEGDEQEREETEGAITPPSGEHLYQGASGTKYQFTTSAQKIKNKPYKMLVLINGKGIGIDGDQETIYDITKKGCVLFQLKKAIEPAKIGSKGVIQGGEGIFMSNHQGLIDVAVNDLQATEELAHTTPIKVNVDRMVAKVMLEEKFTYPKGIVDKSGCWGLDVTNKLTYWVRQPAEKENSSAMKDLYAKDPNFKELTTSTSKEENFKYIRTFRTDGIFIDPENVKNKFSDSQYILENTIPEITKNQFKSFEDQITQVIVGYQYTPAGFAEGDSYYVFNNHAFSQSEMDDYLYEDMPEAEELAGLKAVLNSIDDKVYKLDGTETRFFETQNLRYCPKGYVFYTFPIRHFKEPEGSLGYYGVVRNNIYNIRLNSLAPPVGPDGPYLSGDIHIQPWANRGQETVIGVTVDEKPTVSMKVYHIDYFTGKSIYGYYLTGVEGTATPAYQIIQGAVDQTFTDKQLALDKDRLRDLNYRYTEEYGAIHLDDYGNILMTANSDQNIAVLYYKSPYTDVIMNFTKGVSIQFVDPAGKVLEITKGGYYFNVHGIRHYDVHEAYGLQNGPYYLLLHDVLFFNRIYYTYEIAYGAYAPIVENGKFFFRQATKTGNIGETLTNLTTPQADPIEIYESLNYVIICKPQ